jgi:predicted AAA+ superfamily ATPase
MYKRKLNLLKLLEKKSFFLFGPRSTGKSTLILAQLNSAIVYNLLDQKTYRRLLKSPTLLEEEYIDGHIIVIDEVQKMPELLDEVHRLIFEKDIRFLLTGSSSRKLKHGGANLLAGRAWTANLFPLSYSELPNFDLDKYLLRGGLPQVYDSEYYLEELKAYVGTYLQEEIKAEAVTRNVNSFYEFLEIVAMSNGQEINFERFSSDCQVSTSSLRNYLQILDDTLVGFRLKAYTKTKKRKAISRAKYYLFDTGVVNFLMGREGLSPGTPEYGVAFEHFIILEVRAYLSYTRSRKTMSYWRSTSQFEVDLIIENDIALEIKASNQVNEKHYKSIRKLKEEELHNRFIIVSKDPKKRVTKDGIEIYPWKLFLDELWAGQIIV